MYISTCGVHDHESMNFSMMRGSQVFRLTCASLASIITGKESTANKDR